MALKTKREIEETLVKSAERSRVVREAAQTIKSARVQGEQEAARQAVSLIKPSLSPLRERNR